MNTKETVFIFIEGTNIIAMKQIFINKGASYPTYLDIDEDHGLLRLVRVTDKGSAIYQFISLND